uniref:Phage integrase family protein n=1 Tax=Candidatus Kentrum sp. TUN TaxID=2126343 RepID=A0A451AIB3_9GAMM|nr:MAG: hypothetical protein BECKTUN1418D_GA0071000_13742 [Candidatus Kentron sp. TUN]
MDRVLAETGERRFTEHDLRAKRTSDADFPEHVRALFTHADFHTTQRVCRRRPERVKLGRGVTCLDRKSQVR